MQLEEFRQLLERFSAQTADNGKELYDAAKAAGKATGVVQASWSGSFAGWHGKMYFRDYKTPSLQEQFSIEWGGINGIPEGWVSREPEEVIRKIDKLADTAVSLDQLEERSDSFRRHAERLKADIEIVLADIDLKTAPELDKKLIQQVLAFEFGPTRYKLAAAQVPNQIMCRDSSAVHQGVSRPTWLIYDSAAQEGMALAKSVERFTELAERLLRQLGRASGSRSTFDNSELASLHPDILAKCGDLFRKGVYPEAVEKSFKVVRDRLRSLTGHETGSEAFGKGKLRVKGAAAPNVDHDFNEGAKFLTMAIDKFRNEKSHTSDSKIDDPVRAYEYLRLSSLAMRLLDAAEVKP